MIPKAPLTKRCRIGRMTAMNNSLPSEQRVMSLEQTAELYALLRGGPVPKGFHLGSRPKLSASAAFSVIYVLQEKYRLIPDSFEQCSNCKELYDESESGCYDEKTGRHYCDYHVPRRLQCP